jgi:UDP-glucose 4-epimerase
VHTWIIGAGGLLGSALHRASPDSFTGPVIPWVDDAATRTSLNASLQQFITQTDNEPWRIIWAAGRATTSSTPEQAQRELQVYSDFLSDLAQQPPPGAGTCTLISSAGGIYAGSANPPFASSTAPNPLGAYGNLKLAQEIATQHLHSTGIQSFILRIANLYGPGQDLTKLQGIVSRLCLSAISRTETNIFVPLDTLRDYIYVDDAAARVLHWSKPQLESKQPVPQVYVVASGQSMGLGQVISVVQDVLHTRIPVSFGVNTAASAQAQDIRLEPDEDKSIQSIPLMPFPAGVRRVYQDLLTRKQHP